ncbi:MAG: hypothetical protein U0234_14745 [Sandaracinus sp.]
MHRWAIVVAFFGMASVADAQTPCLDRCTDRYEDCEHTCRAREGADRPMCLEACRVESQACTALCGVRGR